MSSELNSKYVGAAEATDGVASTAAGSGEPDLKDPRVVLSLLEADQVVAAKRLTRFGPRNLSFGVRVLLWGLRAYVVIMFLIVLVSVLQVLHPKP